MITKFRPSLGPIVMAIAMGSGGCTTAGHTRVDYVPETRSISTIALMGDPVDGAPRTLEVDGWDELAAVGTLLIPMGAGVIGGMAVDHLEGKKATARNLVIRDKLADVDFDAATFFHAELERALEGRSGADVLVRTDNRKRAGLMKSYPVEDTDVILDVVAVHLGWMRVNGKTDWRPSADVKVRLVDAGQSAGEKLDRDSVLMEHRIHYNFSPTAMKSNRILAIDRMAGEEEVTSFDDVTAQELEASLQTVITRVAEEVADLMFGDANSTQIGVSTSP